MPVIRSRHKVMWSVAAAASVVVIACVVFSRLLPAPRVGANEPAAPAALLCYAAAQRQYRNAGYGESYAPTLQILVANGLLPSELAVSSDPTPDNPHLQGYHFLPIMTDSGRSLDLKRQMFGVCAIPSRYGYTGINTYVMTPQGQIYVEDTEGSPISDLSEVDESWRLLKEIRQFSVAEP